MRKEASRVDRLLLKTMAEDSPKAQIPVSGVTRIEKLGGKAALILPTR
jgi:hypothetical protein